MVKLSEENICKILSNIHRYYDYEHPKLVKIGKEADTEGAIRAAAGNFVEGFLQNIFDNINEYIPSAKIVSKVGSTDFLSLTINYKNRKITNDTIQVDRHVFSKGKRIAFIENKTYLDSCYYDRALADFKKIVYAMKQEGEKPEDFAYIVFAGQNAASEDKLFFYEAEFFNSIKHLTKNEKGVDTRIFFFLKGKRSSSHPLYKIKHDLDDKVLKNFILYIVSLLP
jgi:hypothetical protein